MEDRQIYTSIEKRSIIDLTWPYVFRHFPFNIFIP